MKKIIYTVYNNAIEFSEYPFKCSGVYKNKILMAADIIEATDKFFAPAAIRTRNGELIFVPFQAEKDDEDQKLPSFYANNHIPIRKVTNIWGIINDPFLDTVHSEEFIEKGYALLENHGISRVECDALRQEVAARMLAYNGILWEWVHLGLYDVLCASLGYLSGEKYRLSDKEFEEFYWRAMGIALKGFD